MPVSDNFRKGYTLLELIMVMAIIGTLGTLFIGGYKGSQVRARDTQRRNDLRQYRSALEVFASNNTGFYPRDGTDVGVAAETTLCSYLGITSCSPDPRNGETVCEGSTNCGYFYQSNNTTCGSVGDACATEYILWTRLERPDTTDTFLVVCSTGITQDVVLSKIPPSPGDEGECPLP